MRMVARGDPVVVVMVWVGWIEPRDLGDDRGYRWSSFKYG
jgi:hypothetical protein